MSFKTIKDFHYKIWSIDSKQIVFNSDQRLILSRLLISAFFSKNFVEIQLIFDFDCNSIQTKVYWCLITTDPSIHILLVFTVNPIYEKLMNYSDSEIQESVGSVVFYRFIGFEIICLKTFIEIILIWKLRIQTKKYFLFTSLSV